MDKPSPQFVKNLEQKLRQTHRLYFQNHQEKNSIWSFLLHPKKWPRFLVPAISGAFVLTLLLINFVLKDVTIFNAQPSSEWIAANETKTTQEIVDEVNNSNEIDQLDQEVNVVLADASLSSSSQ